LRIDQIVQAKQTPGSAPTETAHGGIERGWHARRPAGRGGLRGLTLARIATPEAPMAVVPSTERVLPGPTEVFPPRPSGSRQRSDNADLFARCRQIAGDALHRLFARKVLR